MLFIVDYYKLISNPQARAMSKKLKPNNFKSLWDQVKTKDLNNTIS